MLSSPMSLKITFIEMNLSNGEGYGALLLVLQQLLKEKLDQEGKGQDNPVPGFPEIIGIAPSSHQPT